MTRFTLGDGLGATDDAFVVDLVAEDEAATRKCKPCEDITPKVVARIATRRSDNSEFGTARSIYVCTRCGDLSIQST